MSAIDRKYQELIKTVLFQGTTYNDPNREGTERLEIPSFTFRHEFKDGFPAITTKKLSYHAVITELIWFLRGDTNIKYLIDNNCNIWNTDAYNYYVKTWDGSNPKPITFDKWLEAVKKNGHNGNNRTLDLGLGDLGKVYGHYWRNFDGIDQIKELIDNMINKPMSSELIVSARNPAHFKEQALPCCHYGFQIIMRPLSIWQRDEIAKERGCDTSTNNGQFHGVYLTDVHNIPKYGFELHWNQRSCDLFLGIPFNIASYATLALILEKITGHKALAIQGDLKKVHLYANSIEAAEEQLERGVDKYDNCNLIIVDRSEYERLRLDRCSLNNLLENIEISDFRLDNYESYPPLKVKMLGRTK